MTDVSVLTPSLNYGPYIEENILSVSGQEGVSIQHVIQDAGSKDETVAILEKYGQRLDWASEPDRGQSDALNKAIARAEGKWVSWLNADEFYMPGALGSLVEEAERTGADIVYADCIFVDAMGAFQRLVPQHPFSSVILRTYGCFIASCTTLFRRSALGRAPWDTSIQRVMDWDLYLRLTSEGRRFRHLRYPVGAFRRHQSQVTASPESQWWEEDTEVIRRHRISPRWRRWGRWLHPAYKLLSGAYFGQLRAGALISQDMRWFRPEVGLEPVDRFIQKCYGRGLWR